MDRKEKQIADKILKRILLNEGIASTNQYDDHLQFIYDELKAIQVQAKVKPEIAELEKKIKGYKKIVQFILDNHWKFGNMEQQLLTIIEKVGEKYDL